MKYILTLCLSVLVATTLLAQMKTVTLNEVVVEGLSFEKYASGSKIKKSDSLQMAFLSAGTLADYLQQNSTVYIREQGNRMLASVSFRGTGPAHTGVFWQGINLNSLTLGSSDFNGIPLFLFDDIAVQYGGASSLHGSDAMGGSIHLGSTPGWVDGHRIQLKQNFGSFGNYFSGVKLSIGNGKWESRTKVFNQAIKNDFRYDISDRVGNTYRIRQQNASVHNYALMQEFSKKIGSKGFLNVSGWAGKNYHQIQPVVVSTPDQEQQGDEISDKNIRLIASYEHFLGQGELHTMGGYVLDNELFNNTDKIETQRWVSALSYEWYLSKNTTLKAGANGKYIIPKVWSYQEGLTEWRGDTYLSVRQQLLPKWQMAINMRKTFVPFTIAPLAPSLSTNYKISDGNWQWSFRGQVERSYRVPTFNDRYWGTQGRPDLKSEHGYSMDLGQNMLWKAGDSNLEADIDIYHLVVDDWIAWKPAGGVWRPYNLKKVQGTGVESSVSWAQALSKGQFKVRGMYAYNSTILLRGISDDDPAVGYQLPYTPRHRFGADVQYMQKSFSMLISNSYTGRRNGNDVINEQLPGYLLTDISLSEKVNLGQHAMAFEGKILNVFDVAYQNVNHYAMPGINHQLSINFFINK